MKRPLIVVLAALFSLVVLLPPDLDAQNSAAIRRYAANTRTFGAPNELTTGLAASGSPAGSGGKVIYDKTFFVADDINVLYVTLSATGDTHFGARLQISCLVDRGDGNGLVACNPGPNPIGGAPAGWVTVSRHSGHGEEPAGRVTCTTMPSRTPGARLSRRALESSAFKSDWRRKMS